MANVRLVVVRTDKGCAVVPPYAIVAAGDTVTWKNRTGGRVIVLFPHDGVFGAMNHFHVPIADGTDQTPANAVVSPAANDPRHFPYAVFCAVTKSFAEGNSSPQIIVE